MLTTDELMSTASDFLDFFLKDGWFRTSSHIDASRIGKGSMLFRGQSNANWGLVPSAFRSFQALDDFTPQPPGESHDESCRIRALGSHLHAEVYAVHLFLDSADRLGFPTPLDFSTLDHSQEIMYAALNNRSYDYSKPFPPKSYETSVAFAQHHGVPTRFLDWTESPLAACYFAAYEASVFGGEQLSIGQEIAVYFVSINSIAKDSSPVSLVKVPKFQNSHIRAQQGLFTSFKNANAYFLEHGAWPDLIEMGSLKFQIQRCRLPASESNKLLKLLFDLDITRERLMPSLANAALAQQYRKGLFVQSDRA
jgi:hypothetical protein